MAYSDEVLADTPLIYYKMDDAAGTTTADSSGNGHNATQSGSAGTQFVLQKDPVAKTSTYGIQFNNGVTNGGTLLNPVPGTYPTGDFTVEFWQRAYQSSGARQFWNHWMASGNRSFVQVDGTSGRYRLGVNFSGSGDVEFTAGPTAQVSTKRHVVITWTQSSGTADLWVDGVKRDTKTVAAAAVIAATGSMAVGNGQSGVGTLLTTQGPNVVLDEFALYSSVLADARIEAHYAAGLPDPMVLYRLNPPDISIPQPAPTISNIVPTAASTLTNNATPTSATGVSFDVSETQGHDQLVTLDVFVEMGPVTEHIHHSNTSDLNTDLLPGWTGSVTRSGNTVSFSNLRPDRHWQEDESGEVTFRVEAYNGTTALNTTITYSVVNNATTNPTITFNTASPVDADQLISVTVDDDLDVGDIIIYVQEGVEQEVVYDSTNGGVQDNYTATVTTPSDAQTTVQFRKLPEWKGADLIVTVITIDPDTGTIVTDQKTYLITNPTYPPHMEPFYE